MNMANTANTSMLSISSSKQAYERLEAMAAEYEQPAPLDSIGEFVMNAAASASQFRRSSGVQRAMEDAQRAVRLEYNPEDCELLDHNAVYMGVTALKVRAFRSWVSDILLNAEDKPYTLKASPIPELPKPVEDLIIDKFIEEVATLGLDTTVSARMSEMKQLARAHMDRVTQESADTLETVVHDQLLEGGWRESFDMFIDDLGSMPGAILKGPFVEYQTRMKWDGGKAVAERKAVYRTKRVSPFDIFPAPDCADAQSGSFLIERTRMNQHQLLGAAGVRGFKEEAIRNVVEEYPQGWVWDESNSAMREDADQDGAGSMEGGPSATPVDTASSYDVLIYNGFVKGESSEEWDIADLDPHRAYDMEIWVVAGVTLRAVINPNPLGKRPYYVTSFDKSPGSFWGRGLPCLLRDVQRVANASIRAMVKNMALAAGPVGEYDAKRFAGEEDITEVSPFRLYAVSSDEFSQNTSAAFRFHNINSNARELMEIYERFAKQADDVSGIPAYVLGNPQVSGAGRTLGGLSLLMGNAAKGIKRVISQVDKDIIEPIVDSYVTLNLMFNPRDDIKFDVNVIARGSSGLLQRELMQSRAVELLTLLVPFMQADATGEPIVPREGIQIVIRDAIRGLGYSADQVMPDPKRGDMIGDVLTTLGGSYTQAGTPQPAVDGRSAPPPFPNGQVPTSI